MTNPTFTVLYNENPLACMKRWISANEVSKLLIKLKFPFCMKKSLKSNYGEGRGWGAYNSAAILFCKYNAILDLSIKCE